MALRFIDSFSHYTTAGLAQKYNFSNMGISAGNGRLGSSSCRLSNYNQFVMKQLDNQSTWICGFAYRFTAYPGASPAIIFSLLDSGTQQVEVRLTQTGTLLVTCNGTTVGTGTAVLNANIYYYLELKATIADAPNGVAVLRVAGITDINVSNGDTKNTANATANQIRLGAGPGLSNVGDYCDLYVCDGTGSAPTNDFLGDCRVQVIYPDGAGNYSQWTRGGTDSGANWSQVDETTPNDDTDYDKSKTAGQIDTHTYGPILGNSTTVYGIQYNLYARKDDAGTRNIAPLSRQGGTDYAGTTVPLSTSYTYFSELKEQNPATSAAWTAADINTNSEFGYKLVS